MNDGTKPSTAGQADAVEGRDAIPSQPATQSLGTVVEPDRDMQGANAGQTGVPAFAGPEGQLGGDPMDLDADQEEPSKPRVTIEEVANVQSMIEKCMMSYMSQNEVVQTLRVRISHLLP